MVYDYYIQSATVVIERNNFLLFTFLAMFVMGSEGETHDLGFGSVGGPRLVGVDRKCANVEHATPASAVLEILFWNFFGATI